MDAKDEDITDFGSQATSSESSEEISLIQDLERELGAVVQRHRIPPDELQQLFEVKIACGEFNYQFTPSPTFLV